MNFPSIIFTSLPEEKGASYLIATWQPFVIGRVIMFSTEAETLDYKSKQTDFKKVKIPGYNVFIVQAGFLTPPNYRVNEITIAAALDQMANWFLIQKIQNNKLWLKKFRSL